MSCVFLLTLVVLFLCSFCVQRSWEKQRNFSCKNKFDCRHGEICCRGTCNSTCEGSYCRSSWDCGRRDKCCYGTCKRTCEGSMCYYHHHCKDRSLMCCEGVCKSSCLGSACMTTMSSYRTCGLHQRRRLKCCAGTCSLTCLGETCEKKNDCGGRYNNLKCCSGTCKRSCRGSPCERRLDCHSRHLHCCGYFDNKTCQSTCRNRECSSNADCHEGDPDMRLYCCGDEICRYNCYGRPCNDDEFSSESACRGPHTLFCCGIGKKKCFNGCDGLPCKTNKDCGRSFYYCGRQDERNVSRCTANLFPETRILRDRPLPNIYWPHVPPDYRWG